MTEYKKEWDDQRKQARADAIEFEVLTRGVDEPTFGVDLDGQRWIVLSRENVGQPDRYVALIREWADEYRDGCDDPVLSPNRIAWAVAADAWLARSGEIGVACYWRGTELIVPEDAQP